ncbi:MAG: phospholipase C, phosphocholine-specific, partial [Actinobacteria bacterium]|nr:phospholipase C, phosphocholine-specific [Actinomycetota bacterium]
MTPSKAKRLIHAALAALLLAVGLVVGGLSPAAPGHAAAQVNPCDPWPICKINHMVFIVQENRSFDHYFGTYKSP